MGQAKATGLAFLVSVRGQYRVTGNGVAVQVGGRKLTYGARSAALKRWVGRNVLVAVDLERPAECFAFDPVNRRMIGRLDPNEKIHPLANTDDVREAIAQVQRERKVMRQARASSANRTRTAVQIANADRAARLVELRATGTDDKRADRPVSIRPVRTGFEGASKAVGTGRPEPSEYDNVDFDTILTDPPAASDLPAGSDYEAYFANQAKGITFNTLLDSVSPALDDDDDLALLGGEADHG